MAAVSSSSERYSDASFEDYEDASFETESKESESISKDESFESESPSKASKASKATSTVLPSDESVWSASSSKVSSRSRTQASRSTLSKSTDTALTSLAESDAAEFAPEIRPAPIEAPPPLPPPPLVVEAPPAVEVADEALKRLLCARGDLARWAALVSRVGGAKAPPPRIAVDGRAAAALARKLAKATAHRQRRREAPPEPSIESHPLLASTGVQSFAALKSGLLKGAPRAAAFGEFEGDEWSGRTICIGTTAAEPASSPRVPGGAFVERARILRLQARLSKMQAETDQKALDAFGDRRGSARLYCNAKAAGLRGDAATRRLESDAFISRHAVLSSATAMLGEALAEARQHHATLEASSRAEARRAAEAPEPELSDEHKAIQRDLEIDLARIAEYYAGVDHDPARSKHRADVRLQHDDEEAVSHRELFGPMALPDLELEAKLHVRHHAERQLSVADDDSPAAS
ncbi:hypothetical protein M885DRAFT_518490 [Pelagophyceae sp. CCMP2097]|nr:hypothetical protein M885DRAFT_518490 [Pelagophyceae sp. CCMP2097]